MTVYQGSLGACLHVPKPIGLMDYIFRSDAYMIINRLQRVKRDVHLENPQKLPEGP